MNRERKITHMTDTQMVLEYIKAHGSITDRQATDELGIRRLSGRIWDLRKAGHDIITTKIAVPKRGGKTAHVARYSLAPDGSDNG